MFAPFALREMDLQNRITVSPMAMYSAIDGSRTTFISCITANALLEELGWSSRR